MELCLTRRTEAFWSWFLEHEALLSEMAVNRQQHQSAEVIELVSRGTSLICENLNFNIGGDHEFTFAVDGRNHLFYLLPYVVAAMPAQLRGKWRVFPWMQGTGGAVFGLQMHGVRVDNDELMVSLQLDEEQKSANLRFYAEALAELSEEQRYSAFFVLLENCIGEGLAQACIRQVDSAASLEEGMFPLNQLEARLLATLTKDGRPPDPAQQYFTYRLELEDKGQPRYDVFLGSGCCAAAINAYYNGSAECYQQFETCGARLVQLFYPYREAERQRILDERYEITDRLEAEALGERGSGRETGIVLGGAMGGRQAYIDLLLYDEARFLELAGPILADFPRQFQLTEFRPYGANIALNSQ